MRASPSIGEVLGRRGPGVVRRRARRGRRRRWLIGGIALALLAAAIPAARWLVTAPLFAVDRVEAGPYRFTDPAGLQTVLAGAIGHSLWGGAPGRLATDLRGLPWVKEARIVRRLPSRLCVELHEWRPLLAVVPDSAAAAALPPRLLLLENGELAPPPADLPLPGLPALVGAQVFAREDGGLTLAETGTEAVALMRAVAETGLEAVAPIDYVLAGEQGLGLVLQDRAARLLVGREEFASRLRLFLATREQIEPDATVDLRFRGRVTVVPPDSTGEEEEGEEGEGARDGVDETDGLGAGTERGAEARAASTSVKKTERKASGAAKAPVRRGGAR